MTRRACLLALILAPLSSRKVEAIGFHITGKLTATDQEAQEGYFNLGKDLMLATRPKSPIHDDLKAMVGKEVQVSVFVP